MEVTIPDSIEVSSRILAARIMDALRLDLVGRTAGPPPGCPSIQGGRTVARWPPGGFLDGLAGPEASKGSPRVPRESSVALRKNPRDGTTTQVCLERLQ